MSIELTPYRQHFAEHEIAFDVHELVERSDHAQGVATLTRGRASVHCDLLVTPEPTLVTVRRQVSEPDAGPLLVLGPQIHTRSAEQFRKLNIQYCDMGGNMFIHFADTYVHVSGQKVTRRDDHPAKEMKESLQSLRKMQVIFAFLAFSNAVHAPTREIARIAGVSVGTVSNTMQSLVSHGFLAANGDFEAWAKSQLLDEWVEFYTSKIDKHYAIESYHSSNVADYDPATVHVSGELAATDYLEPKSGVFYVDYWDPKIAFRNKWGRRGSANVQVRQKFWTTPGKESNKNATQILYVPQIVTYAELLASKDPRHMEVAGEMRHDLIKF